MSARAPEGDSRKTDRQVTNDRKKARVKEEEAMKASDLGGYARLRSVIMMIQRGLIQMEGDGDLAQILDINKIDRKYFLGEKPLYPVIYASLKSYMNNPEYDLATSVGDEKSADFIEQSSTPSPSGYSDDSKEDEAEFVHKTSVGSILNSGGDLRTAGVRGRTAIGPQAEHASAYVLFEFCMRGRNSRGWFKKIKIQF